MSNGIKVQSIGALLEEAIEDITIKASGIDVHEGETLSTGLLNLDAALGGLRPGEVTCIVGTSRSGRHSLACQIGLSAAKQGAAVLIVSTETGGRDSGCVVERMKALAVELCVAVVVTVDVSESVVKCIREGGYDPSSIGEAVGGVEDECDALMFLDRSVTLEEGVGADAPDFGKAVVAVARNRHGVCGIAELAFVREYGRFLDLVDDADA